MKRVLDLPLKAYHTQKQTRHVTVDAQANFRVLNSNQEVAK